MARTSVPTTTTPISTTKVNPCFTTSTVSAIIPLVSTVSGSHYENPKKFQGVATYFKILQQKMLFYLTLLNLSKFLKEDPPKVPEGGVDTPALIAIQGWGYSDFLCRNYILNGLHDSMYIVYVGYETTKQLWETLDRKYNSENASSKKFVVRRFLDFKMADSKSVMSQVDELQPILHDISVEGMVMSETFQVAAMIEKLPLSWKDFKNYLKHKCKEMILEDLIIRLRIEEDNKNAEIKLVKPEAKVNDVEHGKGVFKIKTKTIDKDIGKAKLETSGSVSKQKHKFKDKCFNCRKHVTSCRSVV